MIQNDSNIKISNKEVKQFLNKKFGDSIQFYDPERRNEIYYILLKLMFNKS